MTMDLAGGVAPIVSQIVEASAETPCLAMSLKLEMPVIRELLSREEIHVADVSPDSPAMVTGAATVEFLSACCRLMDLLDTPQDIPFLSGLIQREIIYRILSGPEGARLRATPPLLLSSCEDLRVRLLAQTTSAQIHPAMKRRAKRVAANFQVIRG